MADMGKSLDLTANNKRITSLDLARAICALWIIGVWHLSSYAGIDISNDFTRAITSGVLSTFLFISGYFMGGKEINNIKDVGGFLIKRLSRFYPLFFISCTTLYICFILFGSTYINSFKQYILTLLGLSCIITPAPSTLWFMSMLFLFYLLTPLILYFKDKYGQVIICVALYIVMILLYMYIKIDARILSYFPIYCIALLSKTNFDIKINHFSFLIVSIPLFAILVVVRAIAFPTGVGAGILIFLYSMCFIVIVIELCKILSKFNIIKNILIPIGYSSMTAYLFHRQIYGILSIIIGIFTLWECVIALLIVLMASYLIQRVYDFILKKFSNRNSNIYVS